MLINLGQTERKDALANLKERLQRMTPYETMKRQAELVRDMKEVQKGTPLGIYIA
jgi:16S rRNA C1402 (ribose-2'-O) methylase RsmI